MDTTVRAAIAEVVDESIRNNETGHYYTAVVIRRDGSARTASSATAEALMLGRRDGSEVVGTWTGWDEYEADEEIPAEARETAIDALYQQWSEAQP